MIVITCLSVCGLLTSCLSVLTFQKKTSLQAASGWYLLAVSWISSLIFLAFVLKFYVLVFNQMGRITNDAYLTFYCVGAEFLTPTLLSTIDWLLACVAMERALTTLNNPQINRLNRLSIAKGLTLGICLVVPLTYLQDPLHRQLIDDEEENRRWCILQYGSSALQRYDAIVVWFHLFFPFTIDIASALVLIINVARRHSAAQHRLSFTEHLRQQVYELKHLLIGPLILTVLAVPRLIIHSISGCMASGRDPWFYLAGHIISYIPPMLIFVLFVLPSQLYRKELGLTLTTIRRYFHRTWQ